jgi:quercetin dioxygenase-like cupin family protein
MVRAGDVIENPAMGATIRFRQVASDTGGELTEFDFYLRPGGIIAEDHSHPVQEERFEVMCGAVRGHVNGAPRLVATGERSAISPGVLHGWSNATDEAAHLRVQFRPALRSEDFLVTAFALARAGFTDERGVPRFPYRLFMMAAFTEEFRPAGMPVWLHSFAGRFFAGPSRRALARLLNRNDPIELRLEHSSHKPSKHGGKS